MLNELDVAALGQIPAGLYLLLDSVILRDNTPVLGARYEKLRDIPVRQFAKSGLAYGCSYFSRPSRSRHTEQTRTSSKLFSCPPSHEGAGTLTRL